MTRAQLTEKWLARRGDFARLDAQISGAKVIDEFLADLSAEDREEADQLLSLARAAQLSGYSAEHLARCLRTGKIANAGEKNRPRIRREDLPKKPKKSLELGAAKAYNVDADARSILSRRGER